MIDEKRKERVKVLKEARKLNYTMAVVILMLGIIVFFMTNDAPLAHTYIWESLK